MTIWKIDNDEALVLELDNPMIELVVDEHRAVWIDSQTGRVLRWVTKGLA